MYKILENNQIVEVLENGIEVPHCMMLEIRTTREDNQNKIETLTFNFETEKQEVTNATYEDISVEVLKQELEEEYIPKIEKYQTLGLTVKVNELQAEFLEKYNLLDEA